MNKARLNFDLKFPFSRSDGRRGQGMRAAREGRSARPFHQPLSKAQRTDLDGAGRSNFVTFL